MKHFYKTKIAITALIATLLCMVSPVGSFAQLSAGSYTIDPGSSASSTNYQNFASAVGDMVSGSRTDGGAANGPGINGAILFKVADGSYNEQISITAISGSSATNTVTFQSNSKDSTKVNLNYYGNYGTDYVVQLYGASFITFRQMTIEATGGYYGIAVDVENTSYNNSFLNNFSWYLSL